MPRVLARAKSVGTVYACVRARWTSPRDQKVTGVWPATRSVEYNTGEKRGGAYGPISTGRRGREGRRGSQRGVADQSLLGAGARRPDSSGPRRRPRRRGWRRSSVPVASGSGLGSGTA
jgi:hypothetical protein